MGKRSNLLILIRMGGGLSDGKNYKYPKIIKKNQAYNLFLAGHILFLSDV